MTIKQLAAEKEHYKRQACLPSSSIHLVAKTKIARELPIFLKTTQFIREKRKKNILEIFKFFDEIERSKYTDWPIDLRSVSVNCGSTTHLVQVYDADIIDKE